MRRREFARVETRYFKITSKISRCIYDHTRKVYCNEVQSTHMVFLELLMWGKSRILLSYVQEWCSIMGMLHGAAILIYNGAWNDYNSCQMKYIPLRDLEVVKGNIHFYQEQGNYKGQKQNWLWYYQLTMWHLTRFCQRWDYFC